MRYLTVTQEDIDKALEICRGSESLDYDIARDCPIGIALQREFDRPRQEVSANADSLRVGDYWSGKRYRSNRTMQRFMRRFDRKRHAAPHTFRLEDY